MNRARGGFARLGSELRDLVSWARSCGFTVEQSGANHLVFRLASGMPVWASLTPSDRNARKNTKRDLLKRLREAGIEP